MNYQQISVGLDVLESHHEISAIWDYLKENVMNYKYFSVDLGILVTSCRFSIKQVQF